MATPRIVIVGAGAAGVFTAYRLREMYGDAYEIVLTEARDRVGGNCYSTQVEYGGKVYNIDCGAQFFFKNPQPRYTALLNRLGLMESASKVVRAPIGFTVFDKPADKCRFWLPARIVDFVDYDASDWKRLIKFLQYLAYAALLEREAKPDWELSIDDWFARLTLLDSDFKEKVLKPFLYQFVSLPLDRIGEASALYAGTYLVRNLLGEAGIAEPNVNPPRLPALPTFTTYQSMIGLDGVHKKVLEAAKVIPTLQSPISKLTHSGGGMVVQTPNGPMKADHVVFATDPHAAASILEAGGSTNPELIDTLKAFEYSRLPISMQKNGSTWMPPSEDDWEPLNTVVDGGTVTLTTWFGRLRAAYDARRRIPVFKTWGSPAIGNSAHEFFTYEHFIPLPTTTFMKYRAALQRFQGKNGVWFVGGWTTWFDSQEAALDSATRVADAIARVQPTRGVVRMSTRDPERVERSLRHVAERIARVAPPEHKAPITEIIERVATEG